MPFDLSQTVVVFDLDDTLYSEADYVESGVHHVCERLKQMYGVDAQQKIKNSLRENPQINWLNFACQLAGLPISAKESLLWMYRLHEPDIRLSEECSKVLQHIRSEACAVAILTDGRSVTQKLKLNALGLNDWAAYISENYGASKPSPDRFKAIQAHYSARHYVYVADNVQKDFLGCNPLGWIGIGMRGDSRNIYSQDVIDVPSSALPTYWVNSWNELLKLLCK